MKKIDKCILIVFIKPFVSTFFLVLFLLLMVFFFGYIDTLLGKGYEWYVLLELIFWISLTNLSLALPLSVLLSSIMTFGSLGENYELVAIKSSGVSLFRAIRIVGIFTISVSVFTFYFSDYILPIANLKAGSILYDISNQKSVVIFNQSEFDNSIPGYAIKVERKDEKTGKLYDIAIFDHVTNGYGNTFIKAKEANMFITEDQKYLILQLHDGVHIQDQSAGSGQNSKMFIRSNFKYSEQKFLLSGFELQRTNQDLFLHNRQVKNIRELKEFQHKFENEIDSLNQLTYENFVRTSPLMKNHTTTIVGVNTSTLAAYETRSSQETITATAIFQSFAFNKINQMIQNVRAHSRRLAEVTKEKILFHIEEQRKYVITCACFLMFLLGVPLGAIIRKGGMGLPLVVALLFFVFFHILGSLGEKAVREGSMDLYVGMWLPIIIITPIGLFLLYMGSKDSTIFDVTRYTSFFNFKNRAKKKAS